MLQKLWKQVETQHVGTVAFGYGRIAVRLDEQTVGSDSYSGTR